ncbi:MAG: hypothetical protein K6V97_03970 [Actinomycetia bacterium]|nr:hypothetical protein [Actinomycetes bacterium]
MARLRLPDGTWAEGTPEELARLAQLLKSQQETRPVRMPRWVDRTQEASSDAH